MYTLIIINNVNPGKVQKMRFFTSLSVKIFKKVPNVLSQRIRELNSCIIVSLALPDKVPTIKGSKNSFPMTVMYLRVPLLNFHIKFNNHHSRLLTEKMSQIKVCTSFSESIYLSTKGEKN